MHGVDFAQEKMNLLNISSVSVSMSRITAVTFSLSAILQILMRYFSHVLFKKKKKWGLHMLSCFRFS